MLTSDDTLSVPARELMVVQHLERACVSAGGVDITNGNAEQENQCYAQPPRHRSQREAYRHEGVKLE